MDTKLIGVYLNDHLAGSVTGVELARRAAGANEGTDLGRFLASLVAEIEADRDALMALMDELGVRRNPIKQAGGWAMEKLGRLKPNGQLRGHSPLSRLIEVEGLALGITGKLALWRALRAVAEHERALDREALDRLAERAKDQQQRVEERRLEAATAVFAPAA